MKCKRMHLITHVTTYRWGGEKTKTQVSDQDATMTVHLDKRMIYVEPKRSSAEPFWVPMENVRQWFPALAEADAPPPDPTPTTRPPVRKKRSSSRTSLSRSPATTPENS